MDADKVSRIKTAVRRNFESSPVQYDDFESKYGFFKHLNATLLKAINREKCEKILDIGCGTGASSIQLLETSPEARVFGLDNSAAMLEKARAKGYPSEQLVFIEGDAAALTSCLEQDFDTIIYSASIFLIPDFQESLRQAYELLQPGGRMGLTFMDGVYAENGNNLLFEADQRLGLGLSLKKPVVLAELESFVKSIFESTAVIEENFNLPRQVVKEFFSIPAMSAGLFPTLDYEKRLEKISILFDDIAGDNLIFRWIVIVGSKS